MPLREQVEAGSVGRGGGEGGGEGGEWGGDQSMLPGGCLSSQLLQRACHGTGFALYCCIKYCFCVPIKTLHMLGVG